MRQKRSILAAILLLISGLASLPAMAGFLQFPLHGCSDPSCTVNYATHGAYSADAMNSVLDHSMTLNSSNYYPYGTTATSSAGGDLKIISFNGEMVNGTPKTGDLRCVGGLISLHPDWDTSKRMTNDSGCGSSSYSSYDEHPGYDYKAASGTPVYAAATGIVISTTCYLANFGNGGTCNDWGALAINHGNGYFTQYLHMATTITVVPGQQISAGNRLEQSATSAISAALAIIFTSRFDTSVQLSDRRSIRSLIHTAGLAVVLIRYIVHLTFHPQISGNKSKNSKK